MSRLTREGGRNCSSLDMARKFTTHLVTILVRIHLAEVCRSLDRYEGFHESATWAHYQTLKQDVQRDVTTPTA